MIRGVTPVTWGIELTSTVVLMYVSSVAVIAYGLTLRFGWRPAFAVVVSALYFFFGFSTFPGPLPSRLLSLWPGAAPERAVGLFSLSTCSFIL